MKYNPEHTLKDVRGIFLPMVGFLIFSLLALVGLAVDGANLYRANLALQQAVDAAAIAGASRLVENTSDTSSAIPTTTLNMSIDAARSVVDRNMDVSGFTADPATVTFTQPAASEPFTVNVSSQTVVPRTNIK